MADQAGRAWPSCPLWQDPADTEDGEALKSAELGRALTGRAPRPLVLSGDMGPLLRRQPFSDGVPEAEWNIDDDALMGQLHGLYRAAGAECALTHTAGCASAQLEGGLRDVADQVNEQAVREARSCGPRFVMGLVAQRGCALDGEALDSLMLQAATLKEAGVHGMMVWADDLASARALTRAVKKVWGGPLVATVPFAPATGARGAGPATPDGQAPAEAFRALAAEGAHAVGAELRMGDVASFSQELSRAAEKSGRSLVVRLVPDVCGTVADEVGLTGPSAGIARDVGDATRDKAVASAVRTLAGDGACAIWCGGDRPLADTAAVVAQLDALGAR
ncbi:homocysteine S-methyltransferase family protein [Parafannyhessea umbonata]|uniref:homocysteine S-methyltransferase family protein n=1 Tax=Parafannyhessea umbonata TaxID=604330 RepID=UPI00359CB50A